MRVSIALSLASLILSSSGGERSLRAQTRPNILLITLDTVRADRMGFLGSTRGVTPALDAFARSAVVFTRAYAQAPITTASHATILTGTYPPFHGVRDFGVPLGDGLPYLPDIFRRAGYRTGAFVGSLILDPLAGTAPGFDRGFEVYDAGFHLRRPGEDRYQSVERRGDEVVSRALGWLNGDVGRAGRAGGAGRAGRAGQAGQGRQGRQGPQGAQPGQAVQPAQGTQPSQGAQAGRPWFTWVHLFDAHDPYDPPSDLKTKYAATPYDGEIAAVDRQVGRLLQAVPADTLVVVAGDHGEALGDHGEDTHGVFLYESTLHVPLVIRYPDRRASAVATRVRLADVAPTILDAAAIAVPREMQGESLAPLTRTAARGSAGPTLPADRPVYAETDYPHQAFGWSGLLSWRADNLLFVRAPRRELYDEKADLQATKNLADGRREAADRLERELEQFLRRSVGGTAAAANDPALARKLASLGYVGGAVRADGQSAVDPKDRIRTANELRAAIAAVEDGNFRTAVPLLERVTASEPTIPIAQLNLGVARARSRQYAAAIAPLQRVVSLDPESLVGHYELASVLYETGDLKSAAEHFGYVASRMPKWADARYSLGSVYARIDRVADATVELRAALAIEPRHFRANLLLGRILTLQGQAAAALGLLRIAVEVQETNAEAHRFLADAYEKAGDATSAARERRRADELTKK